MTLKLSKKARNDLREIWFYTFENWSEKQADLYIGLLREKIEYLAMNPKNGRDFSHRGKNFKFSQVKSHLIFYREISLKEIEIIRILHQRMDIENRLVD